MKTRSLSTAAAISFIKDCEINLSYFTHSYILLGRLQVQPNYGFVKQLDTFLECGYAPCATHPAYISWKKKQKRDVTAFLNHLIDCVDIVPDTLILSR